MRNNKIRIINEWGEETGRVSADEISRNLAGNKRYTVTFFAPGETRHESSGEWSNLSSEDAYEEASLQAKNGNEVYVRPTNPLR